MVIGVQFAPFIPQPPYAHGSAYPPVFFVLAALARSRLERDWVFFRVPRVVATIKKGPKVLLLMVPHMKKGPKVLLWMVAHMRKGQHCQCPRWHT